MFSCALIAAKSSVFESTRELQFISLHVMFHSRSATDLRTCREILIKKTNHAALEFDVKDGSKVHTLSL